MDCYINTADPDGLLYQQCTHIMLNNAELFMYDINNITLIWVISILQEIPLVKITINQEKA